MFKSFLITDQPLTEMEPETRWDLLIPADAK